MTYTRPDADTLAIMWPDIEPHIERAMEQSFRTDDTLATVTGNLAGGQTDIVLIESGYELKGVAVVELMQRKDGMWLNVWGLSGADMSLWLDGLLEHLEYMASEFQLEGVMCGGRLGWERMLDARGWNRKAVIMEKRVCH